MNLTNQYGRSALHMTAIYGLKSTATILIEAKADINVQDEKGRAPLHDAALNGHTDMVELLLGGNKHSKTNRGWTASEEASSRGHIVIANLIGDEERKKPSQRRKRDPS